MKTNKLLVWSIVCLVLSAFAWANWDAPSIAKVMGGKDFVLLKMDQPNQTIEENDFETLLAGTNYSFDAQSGTIAIVFDPEETSKSTIVEELTSDFNIPFVEVQEESDAKGCPVGAWSIFLAEMKDFLCLRQPQLQK